MSHQSPIYRAMRSRRILRFFELQSKLRDALIIPTVFTVHSAREAVHEDIWILQRMNFAKHCRMLELYIRQGVFLTM